MKTTIEKIPVYALSALINGDYSGLYDEDVKNIEEWLASSGIREGIWPGEEGYNPYFTHYPAFGLATDVIDCECVIEW